APAGGMLSPVRPSAKRRERKAEPVEVVVDVVVAREPGARVLVLVPGAVLALTLEQPPKPSFDDRRSLADRVERDQRPGRLRRGARAPADPGGVVVGAGILAPAAVLVLDLREPANRPAQPRIVGGEPAVHQRGHRGAGAVDVVDPPA